MDIKNAIALVTGGNRGLGKAFVEALLAAGAQRVYIGTRQPIETSDPRLQSVTLDVTSASSIAAAVEKCQDVTLLLNNAGVARISPFLQTPSLEKAREEMETNYFGVLAMSQAFAPILKKNGGGALVNMLSVVSWFTSPRLASYSASKAAALSLTNGLRIELRAQGTQVVGVHAGFINTEMIAQIDVDKVSPEEVARKTIEGIAAGAEEVLADQRSHSVKAALASDPQAYYRQLQEVWDKTVS